MKRKPKPTTVLDDASTTAPRRAPRRATRNAQPAARPLPAVPCNLAPVPYPSSGSSPSSPQDAPPAVAARHVRAIAAILDANHIPAGSRLLDIGCGLGRQAAALARAGYHVTGLDIRFDPQALSCWRAAASRQPRLHFLTGDARRLPLRSRFRGALLLYNTFALFRSNDDALALLAELRRVLPPRGLLLIDNVCRTIWKEIAAGRYADGLSDDGLWQMLWLPGRNVFALRHGDQVDPRLRHPRPGETLYRAWSLDELDLLFRLAGWSLDPATTSAPILLARPTRL
jgi:SAM-dependent methyltransferase